MIERYGALAREPVARLKFVSRFARIFRVEDL